MEFPVQIGTTTGHLAIPGVEWIDDAPILQGWKIFRPASYPVFGEVDYEGWGEVGPWRSDSHSTQATLTAALFRWDASIETRLEKGPGESLRPAGRDVVELADAADEWLERLRRWIGATTDHVTVPGWAGLTTSAAGTHVWTWAAGEPGHAADLPDSTRVSSVPENPEPISGSDLGQILDEVSAGEEPQLERVLMGQARNALHIGDRRRALLDVGTAMDIVLGHALEFELQGVSADLAGKLTQRATLGRKAQLLAHLNLPAGLHEAIRERNAVVHDGTEPERGSVERAIDVATQLVNRFDQTPLTSLAPPDNLKP